MKSDAKPKKSILAVMNPAETLIADFQTAQMLLQAIANANYQAEQAEYATLNKFSTYKQQNSPYVKPQDLPFEEDKSLTHASLDSHLQKVQSKQIKQHGLQTIHDLELNAITNFADRKVNITVLDKGLHPFHNNWLDQRTGRSYLGDNHSRSIAGKIIEINLANNYIVLKPSAGRQLVSRALKGYVTEVINPSSGLPMINIQMA